MCPLYPILKIHFNLLLWIFFRCISVSVSLGTDWLFHYVETYGWFILGSCSDRRGTSVNIWCSVSIFSGDGSQARIQKFFKGEHGWSRRKILKEKCLLIHVSTRVHIKTRQTCKIRQWFWGLPVLLLALR